MDVILRSFGLVPFEYSIEKIGSGHIHQTYRLSGANNVDYILQRVNKSVFKEPEIIASNLKIASDFLNKNFPEYSFLRSINSVDSKEMYYDGEGFPWRLFPYRGGTTTIEKVDQPQEAFEAAKGFGQLTAYLHGIDVARFHETIPKFHDLSCRFRQFELSLANASEERKHIASDLIEICQSSHYLVKEYENLIASRVLTLRITHNDTKINNILFDEISRKAVLVIDLDTLMPGYFIYDLGDMVRTFVSPVTEEEKDFSKIIFRKEIYAALLDGYLSQMGSILSEQEKTAIPFAARMMTFIMALRFLMDYLDNDVYYQTYYPGQNLVRAGNQLRFMELIPV
ncbi:aminoglycoside phosphotransferase family protein [soil metagenome]